MDLAPFAKLLLTLGILLTIAGLFVLAMARGWLPSLPRLPGDFAFRLGNARIFVPLATSLVVSIVLTVLLNLIARR